MLVYLMLDFLSLTTHVDDRLNPARGKLTIYRWGQTFTAIRTTPQFLRFAEKVHPGPFQRPLLRWL